MAMSSVSLGGPAAQMMDLQKQKMQVQQENALLQKQSREKVGAQLMQESLQQNATTVQIQRQSNEILGQRVNAYA